MGTEYTKVQICHTKVLKGSILVPQVTYLYPRLTFVPAVHLGNGIRPLNYVP